MTRSPKWESLKPPGRRPGFHHAIPSDTGGAWLWILAHPDPTPLLEPSTALSPLPEIETILLAGHTLMINQIKAIMYVLNFGGLSLGGIFKPSFRKLLEVSFGFFYYHWCS